MKYMFKIDELVNAAGGKLLQKGRMNGVTGVSIDSRRIEKGDCFIALKGAHFDGASFINDAVAKGAAAVIASGKAAVPAGAAAILADDPVAALGGIAAHWRARFVLPCAAVTGSNGKSTTKQMIASALRLLGSVLKTEGNFNNLIGLPLTVLRLRKGHDVAVFEMGMNAPGEIARLAKIAAPCVGLITNVCPAHLELLGSIENVAKAKGELFENMKSGGTIVVNLEDAWVRKLSEGYKGNIYTYGMQNGADVQFGRMESRGLESVDMTVYVEGKELRLHLPVPGTHNVMNAMAAISVARAMGVPADDAVRGVGEFEPMAMRMERIQLSKGIQLVNDSYNANPFSVKEALRTVSGAKRAGRLVAVLGDMLELGERSSECHREVGEAAAGYKVDRLFAFGEFADDTASGAKGAGMNSGRVSAHADIEKLKGEVADFANTGDIILVKGSRGMRMERIVEHLKDAIGVE